MMMQRTANENVACERRICRALLPDGYQTFCHISFGLRLEYMFERNLKLSLHIPKRFKAFQVLKWFSLILRLLASVLHA